MFRKTLVIAVLASFFAGVLFAQDEAEKKENNFIFVLTPKIGGEVEVFGSVVKSAKNFPEYMRYVPIHPSDESKVPLENNAPVPDDRIKPELTENASFNIGFISFLKLSRLVLNFEAEVYFSKEIIMPESWSIRRRDYLKTPGSSERGEGTALTYYGVFFKKQNHFRYRFELGFEVFKRLKKNNEGGISAIIFGFNQRKYDFFLEQGWDRWDSLEKRKSFVLEKFYWRDFYLGYKVMYFPEKTDLGVLGIGVCGYFNLGISQASRQQTVNEVSVVYKNPLFFRAGITICYPALVF